MFCGGFGGYGFGPTGGIGPGFMFLTMGFRLLILAAIIFLGVKLYKNHFGNQGNTIRILEERFAKGEISEDEYLKRKAILANKN